jgi:hypothetical protein
VAQLLFKTERILYDNKLSPGGFLKGAEIMIIKYPGSKASIASWIVSHFP